MGCVYVHCKIGYSRSAAVVLAWLIVSGRASSTHEATAMLRKVRPSVVIRPEIVPAVAAFVTAFMKDDAGVLGEPNSLDSPDLHGATPRMGAIGLRKP
jgi:hypothetical protein